MIASFRRSAAGKRELQVVAQAVVELELGVAPRTVEELTIPNSLPLA
jgi:hypothetical protein